MVFRFALLSSLFLASVILAAPSSWLDARLARRGKNRQSQPLIPVQKPAHTSPVEYTFNWAGAVLDKDKDTLTGVTGTFVVPTVTSCGPGGSAAAAWVGIDGDTCAEAILQTGIDFTVGNDGSTSYDAWYQWYPDGIHDFSGITINAGDIIRATVIASSTTTGIAVIENLTSGQTATHSVRSASSSSALCEQNAEWVVEDVSDHNGLAPLPDFGNVTFTDAVAFGPHGVYEPSGAHILDIKQDSGVLTSVSTSGSSVTILRI